MNDVLESAIGVLQKRYAPMYTAEQYEDCLLDVCKSEARVDESPAAALVRLIDSRDERVEACYAAARRAERDVIAKNQSLVERRRMDDEAMALAERKKEAGETREQAFSRLLRDDPEMQDLFRVEKAVDEPRENEARMLRKAEAARRDGETVEQAMVRLMDEDPEMADLYGKRDEVPYKKSIGDPLVRR